MFLKEENIGNIRAEIEQHITRQRMTSTSVEIPLTNECKKVLNLASDEARRLNHRYVGTAHLLLGMLEVEGSLASRLLQTRGLNAEAVRERTRAERSSIIAPKRGHRRYIRPAENVHDLFVGTRVGVGSIQRPKQRQSSQNTVYRLTFASANVGLWRSRNSTSCRTSFSLCRRRCMKRLRFRRSLHCSTSFRKF
jgi:ATP-dependent Clp protease ATP-binding subunit ClpA